MNRMLIVGNGFDLEHGLKTAYWNFREYLEENHLDFLIAFEKMYNFYPVDFGDPYVGKDAQQKWEKNLKSKLWESFEEAIGSPDIGSMLNTSECILDNLDLDGGNVGIEDTMDEYWRNEYGFIKQFPEYNDDNWLFPNQPLKTHDISYDDIQYLLNCADIDDHWAEDVQKMVQDRDEHPEKRGDFIIDEFRVMNASGTTILFPYGDRIITFCSKRQFFRGENQDFPYSIPSLRRKTMGMSKKQEELMRTVANMKIWQFRKLLWNNINVVPYWEAKLSDVNYKALAQHYGFDTNLLDLTNDFRIALFFATCKYVPEQDCFRPLTEQEINENHKYGIIYHAPNWVLDFISPGGSLEWYFQHMNDEDRWYGLDNGDLDGMAFQIGYQPLMRCHHQSGYVYPLRYGVSLNEDRRFERMRFKQSVELSQWVFKMMDGGKKVFPQEGITEIRDILIQIQNTKRFSYDDLMLAYDMDRVNKELFPTVDDVKKELEEQGYYIEDDEVQYLLDEKALESVNEKYDGKDLLKPIGGRLHFKSEDKRYRDERCMEIYGKMI